MRTKVLVVAEDLQLDGKVDLAQRYVRRHAQHGRGEVEHRAHAYRDQAVGDVLGDRGRRCDHRHRDLLLTHDLFEVGQRVDDSLEEPPTDFLAVRVERGDNPEAPLRETPVVT